jgi:antitoxin ParD1/3/4
MATMNVSLPGPMKQWVEARAKGGRYSNASDYVRDLIRKDQERNESINEIQALVTQGIESGPAQLFDKAVFLTRVKQQNDGTK